MMFDQTVSAEVRAANDALCERILEIWRRTPERLGEKTVVPNLHILVRTEPVSDLNCFYTLSSGIILQGSKRVSIDGRQVQYGSCTTLITAADTPSSYEIYAVSPSRPYVSVSLSLEPLLISELVQKHPEILRKHGRQDFSHDDHLFTVSPSEFDIIDAFARLVRLLDTPEQIAARQPMIVRELVYMLLMSEAGAGLTRFFTQNSTANRINRTIAWIRQNTGKPLDIDALADMASMTRSTFYRHFKMVTKLSPLQYHKRQCLFHAHFLMVAKGYSATQAAYEVGYASPNQFSREYKRTFGVPPKQSALQRPDIQPEGVVLPS